MTEIKSQKLAIIIGAGPAGLTAAYQLLKDTDIKPIILEESEFIGGISRTAQYKGNRMDIGGHRFFSKNSQVNDIWQELMPTQGSPSKDDKLLGIEKPLSADGPDPEKTDKVMLVRNRVSRIFYLRSFFDYPISIKPATFINMGFIRTMKAGFGLIGSSIKKREEKSLEDFYVNRFGRSLYEMFFEDYTEKLWGVHPSNISPEWGAQRVKELSLSKAIIEMLAKLFNKNHKSNQTSLIEQFVYPKKGPGQLWEIMASEIEKKGGEIRLNSRVTGINTDNNTVKEVVVTDQNGNSEVLCGDLFFSTMPVKDLIQSMGDTVPAKVNEIAANLPYRDFITVGLLLKKLKIKNQTKIKTVGNIVPDCWIYIQERDVKIGRLQIFNNWSPYMVNDNENTVWVGLEYFCTEGDKMWNMASEDFIKFAIDELAKIDVIEKDDVIDSTHIRVKKAYPAYFGTYSDFDKVREYLDGFENLYCLGRNGQHRYNNMDHSMLTAIEAVNLIKNNNPDKSAVWNVNTEEEYHESK
ncbi:NAD(P)/FAD-dependent oxidoreductase [Acetivibrio cellulolyticus]|uniref:NAD(P)/FAD-dependent oxidoreductase n=1 Tax=Acetivibrio cellulolyticus TaxID=35830 RepID=UPI0001E2C1CC|nr:NAD(P)/FAD-dependent oxidoreductase [Acetivibrio cellulolyticus]